MRTDPEQVLLRAYLQSADRTPHTPTYELLVKAARKFGLAGATVLRGRMGLGRSGLLHDSAWSIVRHVPVIVEIVDAAERIAAFIEGPVEQLSLDGMLTLERARVVLTRHGSFSQADRLELGGVLEPLSTVPKIQRKDFMEINETGLLLRVLVGESDVHDGKPLFEAIVHKARELGLAGATVLRGVVGFGAHSVVHKARLLEMSVDLPMVIEIVDTEANIERLLPHLETMVRDGMITMEHVMIVLCRPGRSTSQG